MDPKVFRREAIVLLKTGSGHFDNADLKAIDMMAACRVSENEWQSFDPTPFANPEE
jgi:hypothetical protein